MPLSCQLVSYILFRNSIRVMFYSSHLSAPSPFPSQMFFCVSQLVSCVFRFESSCISSCYAWSCELSACQRKAGPDFVLFTSCGMWLAGPSVFWLLIFVYWVILLGSMRTRQIFKLMFNSLCHMHLAFLPIPQISSSLGRAEDSCLSNMACLYGVYTEERPVGGIFNNAPLMCHMFHLL